MKKINFIAFLEKFLNNGWRKVSLIKEWEKKESYNELPKPGYYHLFTKDNKIEYDYYYSGDISADGYIQRNVIYFMEVKRKKIKNQKY